MVGVSLTRLGSNKGRFYPVEEFTNIDLLKKVDMNGGGTVTIAERTKQEEKRFALLDRNNDGKLDRDEFRHRVKFGKHKGDGARKNRAKGRVLNLAAIARHQFD